MKQFILREDRYVDEDGVDRVDAWRMTRDDLQWTVERGSLNKHGVIAWVAKSFVFRRSGMVQMILKQVTPKNVHAAIDALSFDETGAMIVKESAA